VRHDLYAALWDAALWCVAASHDLEAAAGFGTVDFAFFWVLGPHSMKQRAHHAFTDAADWCSGGPSKYCAHLYLLSLCKYTR
jgi:hypothetical protein